MTAGSSSGRALPPRPPAAPPPASRRPAAARPQVPRRAGAPPPPQQQQQQQQPPAYPTVEQLVGNTPLVQLVRLPSLNPHTTVLAKLEGHNPAGSSKDRPALHMLREAERRGAIKPGDTIIEATSGNTGIALAMAAALRGYKLKLILPATSTEERKATMAAFGAEVILSDSMEAARDMLSDMEARGLGHCLDQYNNEDNTASHYGTTGPEVWRQTRGRVTHLVSTCGTFGTVMGTGGYLRSRNPGVQVIGVQPAAPDAAAAAALAPVLSAAGVAPPPAAPAAIPGIRRWPPGYLPGLYNAQGLDRVVDVTAREAEEMARALARAEGVLPGVSGGGAVSAALRVGADAPPGSVIVALLPDRGDRYLSTGLFDVGAGARDPAPCLAPEFHSALARLIFAAPGPHYVMFRSAAGGCERERAGAAAARRAVEAGGGRLLEVVAADGLQLRALRLSLMDHFGLDLPSTPALVSWGARGPGSCLPAPAIVGRPAGAADADKPPALLLAVPAFVRDTWDEFAPGAPPPGGAGGAA